jgi:putative PIN family toxin of toxin-antitoxin system
VRAVLDPNVIIAAVLSPHGAPAKVLRAWLNGAYELVVSPLLLAELERALAYPKLRARVTAGEAAELIALLGRHADVAADGTPHPGLRSADPGDDYLIALAAARSAMLVSGDRHLLDLAARIPVESPASFLARLARDSGSLPGASDV